MLKFLVNVISLEKDCEKRRRLSSISCKASLSLNYINAVDGRNLTAIEYFDRSKNSNFLFNRRTHLTPSELGCFLSHRMSFHNFLKSDAEWLLELEDDVSFDQNLSYFMNSYIDQFDINSLLILGGQEGLQSFKRVVLGRPNFHLGGSRRVWLTSYRWLYRTCCFALHRSMVIKLLNLFDSKTFVADNWSFIVKNANFSRVYFTQLVSHPVDLSLSSIESERKKIRGIF